MNHWKRNNTASKLTIVLFVIYLIVLFWILLFKLGVQFSYMEYRAVNLIPFSESLVRNGNTDFGDIIMNVIIFIPLGLYAGILSREWFFGKFILFFFLFSLMIEVLQFIFRIGAFDITDTITNTLGGIIGLVIFNLFENVFKSSVKAQKVINNIAAIATILMIIFLFLLKTNNLWMKYQ